MAELVDLSPTATETQRVLADIINSVSSYPTPCADFTVKGLLESVRLAAATLTAAAGRSKNDGARTARASGGLAGVCRCRDRPAGDPMG